VCSSPATLTFEAPAIGVFKQSDVAGVMLKYTGMGSGETQNPAFVLCANDTTYTTQSDVAGPLDAHYYKGPGSRQGGEREYVAQTMDARRFALQPRPPAAKEDNTLAFSSKDYGADASHVAPTLRACGHTSSHANGGGPPAVLQPRAIFTGDGTIADPIGANEAKTYTNEGSRNFRLHNCGGEPRPPAMAVRRLTPVECERLQGFPDNYTDIPWKGKLVGQCPDGPRYKALDNSMAVPVIRWIGFAIARTLETTR